MWFGVLRCLLAMAVLVCLTRPGAAAPPVPLTNRLRADYDVQADGRFTATLHIEQRAGTDAVARSLALVPWQYSPSHEQVQIVSAYTLKADGKKLPVDLTTIRDPAPDASKPLALFSDLRQKLIPFTGVTVGDSIVIELHETVFHPLLPGVFSIALLFDRTQAWDDVRVTVTAPGSVKLLADTSGPAGTSVGDGAVVTYVWRYRNTDVVPDAPGLLSPVERLPRLLITSATDWQQIGRAYAAVAMPSTAVTPLVRETADTATAGVVDHRAVAEHLYDWVRQNIRYIPVPIGETTLAPHAADAVLANRVGDSQDEAVLLCALLAAKGIASELVLIDLDALYRLSVPVPLAQLSHVMLYVPEFAVYADPTASAVRFGELLLSEYGKPVVHAVTSGEAVSAIPLLAPGAAHTTLTTTAHLTADDMIVGDTRNTATGPFEVTLRIASRRAAGEAPGATGNRLFHPPGEDGTGWFDPPPPEAPDGTVVLTGHFEVSAWPHISADHRLSLPDGMVALPRPGDLLIGPLAMANLPADVPTPCFAGQQTETVTLDLGTKYRVTQLPADRKVANDAFSFTSHWSQEGPAVTVRREFVSRVTEPVCAGKLRIAAADALREIRSDYAERVGLAAP